MVIQTDFGLTVTFTEWSGRTAITLPSTYMGAVCGLCGNFNGDAEDDFLMSDGHLASNPTSLGQSWTVGGTSGCSVVRIQPQPDQEALKQQQYSTKGQCQVILDKSGPFRMCHSKVDPQGYFSDCVYDYYLQQGQQDIICQAVASYVAACQEAGAMVYPWRTQKFCREFTSPCTLFLSRAGRPLAGGRGPSKIRALLGPVLSPVLFNNFTNNLHDGIEGMPSKFEDDAKLSGIGDTPEGKARI